MFSNNSLLQILSYGLSSVVTHTVDVGYLKEATLLATVLRVSLFFSFSLATRDNELHE